MVGAGVWGEVQLDAWQRLGDATIIALCDKDEARLATRAEQFGITGRYTSLKELLREEKIDFVDVCVRPEAQATIVKQIAEHGLPILCQKPFCTSLKQAREVVAFCRERNVRLMVNENFRWQGWYRKTQALLQAGSLGKPFLARVNFRLRTSLPTFTHKQAYFKDMPRWAVFELGVHYLDLCRFLFGEPTSLYARLHHVSPHVRGEDVELIVLGYDDLTCLIQHSWASVPVPGLDRPENLSLDAWEVAHGLEIDGTSATLALKPDRVLSLHRETSTEQWTFSRETRSDSVTAPLKHFVSCLSNGDPFETSGEDYLHTMALVYASYRSAERNSVIHMD